MSTNKDALARQAQLKTYLRTILPGGTEVYTLKNDRGGYAVMVQVNDEHGSRIVDITQSIASFTGLRMKGCFVYYPGTGFNHAQAIVDVLAAALYPETPTMENLRHRSL